MLAHCVREAKVDFNGMIHTISYALDCD
jgi:hypothetical protein